MITGLSFALFDTAVSLLISAARGLTLPEQIGNLASPALPTHIQTDTLGPCGRTVAHSLEQAELKE